ncbi:hypothetical protein KC19_12G126800 [Ceratodon purpureus]|uniref:Chromatin assembly factor 1 subunit A dimerization domain-containing protein n=1 Tax=Ceratodon purpureus TaxID=3225 RepID=A0A8T0GC93_CERPU|nr:hypothetical protein KC19_12G126800 [Ceratodon purpureus]
MVTSAERERMKQEKEAEKQRIRESKEAARAEREMKKQQEVVEKEKKRKEREAHEAEKELKRKENELKRKEKEARKQQEEDKKKQIEAEKEQRRKEKEAVEAEKENKRKEKELKRQHEEAEKETKRKEKEAAERKKQLVLQKQANIMSRLFRRKDSDSPAPHGENRSPDTDQQPPESMSIGSPEPSSSDVVSRVDEELRSACMRTEAELLRDHVVSWQEKWKARSAEPFRRWGVRTAPKVAVCTELRLQGTGMGSSRKIDFPANARTGPDSEAPSSSLKRKREEDESLDDCNLEANARTGPDSEAPSSSLKRKREEDESLDDCNLEDNVVVLDDDEPDVICTPPKKKQCGLRWKLLQFDKSHRPAYYGTMSKVSKTIRPRHPLRKDASLDYEVDSDEEWEEEDPGESLSDCEDKEEDLEKVDVESDEEAGDGFVVPDGYLSENEGVHVEEPTFEIGQSSKQVPVSGESSSISEGLATKDQMGRKHQHQMKLLDNVIKHALQRNKPFLINNLVPGENDENQTERLCLQALRMVVVAPDIIISPPDASS